MDVVKPKTIQQLKSSFQLLKIPDSASFQLLSIAKTALLSMKKQIKLLRQQPRGWWNVNVAGE